jgi:hypothetical protein
VVESSDPDGPTRETSTGNRLVLTSCGDSTPVRDPQWHDGLLVRVLAAQLREASTTADLLQVADRTGAEAILTGLAEALRTSQRLMSHLEAFRKLG